MLKALHAPSQKRRARALAALKERYKPLLHDGIAEALARLRLTAPERFARGALTVITFHRVLPEQRLRRYPIPRLCVTPEQLERLLSDLAQHFTCLPLIEAFRFWREPLGLDRPPLGVTFDDGALDNFEHARPVLQRLSIRGTFYIPVESIELGQAPWHDRLGFALLSSLAVLRKRPEIDFDRLLAPFGCSASALSAVLPDEAVRLAAQGVANAKRLSEQTRRERILALETALGGDQVPDWASVMSWEQIRQLAAEGHEIGSHSLTHPLLPELDNDALREEIAVSRTRLAKATGAEISSFCYPNGSYDERCVAAVRDAGYSCAVTTAWGVNRRESPYELDRCDMDYARLQSRRGEFSSARLYLRLSGLLPRLPKARRRRR